MKTEYSKTIEKPCGFQFALWSAGAKAFEFTLPENERAVYDPYALYYSGKEGMKMVAMMNHVNPAIRKAIALRARFMDDYSKACLEKGIQQVVLLGAGYDSRFLRLSGFNHIPIFELDLPSTQTVKKMMTKKLLGHLPSNVTYVPINFATESVVEKLTKYRFNRRLRTLFIWEGVTLFLNHDIIAHTLGNLFELGNNNCLTFDFVPPELVENDTGYDGNRKLLEICKMIKEPITFGSSPESMNKLLIDLGYKDINIVGMNQVNSILGGKNDIEDCYYFATAEIIKPEKNDIIIVN